jgi:A/G-specific adenine glycosylase
VLKLGQGLGYYSRARNLHRAAQELVNRYGGRFPNSAEAFQALPGVGPYTAGAVYSIAFGQPVPAVDGNVQRVMARYLGIREEVQTAAARRVIHAAVTEWLHQAPPPEVTQAIMELGSLVCTPQVWRCDACPLEARCVARRDGLQAELPVRRRRPDRALARAGGPYTAGTAPG